MRPNIRLHEFIVMPNHIHGIIEIIPTPPHPVRTHCMRPPDMPNHGQSERLGRVQRAPTNAATTDNHGQSEPGHGQHAGDIVRAHCMRPHDAPPITNNHGQRAPTVGDIVRGYKSAVTKRINEIRNISGVPVWQRNYYEHIIRNEIAYLRISEYIQANPRRWQDDNYHD
jgi:REP element-mobilizing transposase RayT